MSEGSRTRSIVVPTLIDPLFRHRQFSSVYGARSDDALRIGPGGPVGVISYATYRQVRVYCRCGCVVCGKLMIW